MLNALNGKKTYLTVLASLVYAAAAYYTGHIDAAQAFQIAQTAVLGAFIRHGIATGA